MPEWMLKLGRDFHTAFIVDGRWKYLVEGIENTLILTFFALLLGVVLGDSCILQKPYVRCP